MSLKVVALRREWIPAVADMYIKAFASDHRLQVVYPTWTSPENVQWICNRIYYDYDSSTHGVERRAWLMCVVNEDDKADPPNILSYLEYILIKPESTRSSEEAIEPVEYTQPPEGTNLEAFNTFRGQTLRKRQETMGTDTEYFYLSVLFTSTSTRRKGAGSMLLSWSNALAKEMKLDCYVNAARAGISLYGKHGFEKVGEIAKDVSKWSDRESVIVDFAMLQKHEKIGSQISSHKFCQEKRIL